MIETLAAGLIIAAISALTWVAYSHPEDFKRASPKFLLLSVWASTLISAWFYASFYTQDTIAKGLRERGQTEAASMLTDILENNLMNISVLLIVGLAWLMFLMVLEFWVTGLKKDTKRPRSE